MLGSVQLVLSIKFWRWWWICGKTWLLSSGEHFLAEALQKIQVKFACPLGKDRRQKFHRFNKLFCFEKSRPSTRGGFFCMWFIPLQCAALQWVLLQCIAKLKLCLALQPWGFRCHCRAERRLKRVVRRCPALLLKNAQNQWHLSSLFNQVQPRQ